MTVRFKPTPLIYAFLIAALTLLAYSGTFESPFIFDDAINIVENSSLFNRSSFWEILIPPRGTGVAGRPLINLSLAFNYAVSGENTWSYHLFNLLVHILAALSFFGIVRRSLLFHGSKADHAAFFAFACAILWALHPLQTESVTYIIQRCESLMGLFFLTTFYCAIRGWQSDSPENWHLAAVVSFILGVGSKEVIVAAAPLLFLYDLIFVHQNPKEILRRSPLLYAGLLLGLILLFLLVAAGGTSSSGTANLTFSPMEYWITQTQVLAHYIFLSFRPYPLCIDYAWPMATGAEAWPYLALTAMLLTATAYALIRAPRIGFLGLWFFAILAPTSLMPLPDAAFEHRMYLPLAAIVVLSVAGVSRLSQAAARRLPAGGEKGPSLAGRGALYLLLFACSALLILTYGRNLLYRSDISIWNDAVLQCPENSRARVNLGSALVRSMMYPEALPHLQESLRIEVKNALRYAERQPPPGEHKKYVDRYLSIRSVYAFGRYNLGVAHLSLGRSHEAIDHFREALRVRPDYPSAHTSLGIALYLRGQKEEAFRHLRRAVDLKPSDANALTNLGAALRLSGDLPEALQYLSKALRLKPDNTEAHYAMGLTLQALGRAGEADFHLGEAKRLHDRRMADAAKEGRPQPAGNGRMAP